MKLAYVIKFVADMNRAGLPQYSRCPHMFRNYPFRGEWVVNHHVTVSWITILLQYNPHCSGLCF